MKNRYILFFTFFLGFPSFAPVNSNEFNVTKCHELLNLFGAGIDVKNTDHLFEINRSLRLVVPSLGDLKLANEMSMSQKIEMEDHRKELQRLGVSEDMLKLTRVERFEFKGQLIDIFMSPDGEVHHISSYLKDNVPKRSSISRVKNCKIEN